MSWIQNSIENINKQISNSEERIFNSGDIFSKDVCGVIGEFRTDKVILFLNHKDNRPHYTEWCESHNVTDFISLEDVKKQILTNPFTFYDTDSKCAVYSFFMYCKKDDVYYYKPVAIFEGKYREIYVYSPMDVFTNFKDMQRHISELKQSFEAGKIPDDNGFFLDTCFCRNGEQYVLEEVFPLEFLKKDPLGQKITKIVTQAYNRYRDIRVDEDDVYSIPLREEDLDCELSSTLSEEEYYRCFDVMFKSKGSSFKECYTKIYESILNNIAHVERLSQKNNVLQYSK